MTALNVTTSNGTSGPRPYYGTTGGWLDARDAFLAPDAIRGWPTGGSAERPSTLTTYTGDALIPSWDRCVAALRRVEAARMEYGASSWVDTFDGRRISRMLGRPEPQYHDRSPRGYRSATDAAVAWLAEHALALWRFDEALRLAGKGRAHFAARPYYELSRTPEEIAESAIAGRVVTYYDHGPAAALVPPGGYHPTYLVGLQQWAADRGARAAALVAAMLAPERDEGGHDDGAGGTITRTAAHDLVHREIDTVNREIARGRVGAGGVAL